MQEPIRILQVLTIMNRGGAETMIMNYYRQIDRTKIQFDFLLHRQEKGVFDDEILALGGKIYRMPKIRLHRISGYNRELSRFFEEHNEYKIIHSHLNALSVFVLRAAKKRNIPVRIAHSHTSLYSLNLNPFSSERHNVGFAFRFIVQNVLKSRITRFANHYFSCGAKAGIWLYGKKNFEKLRLLNNALDARNFSFDKEKSDRIKNELGIEGNLVIGHVGNLVPEKNHAFIIKVFKAIQKIDPKSRLLLVGAYSREDLEGYIGFDLPENVEVLGLRNDVPDVLQAMDIFLFPSTNEGLPLTLIEAQASGLKIKTSSNITRELNLTDLIEFISLEKSPTYWAERIMQSFPYERRDTRSDIINGGYDIKNNAKSLEEFYLAEHLKQ